MATTTPQSSIQATSVDAFIGSVGVNAHMDSGEANWLNTQKIAGELSYLGVQNVRDGTPYDWVLPEYVTLAKDGIKFDLEQENPTAAALTTIGSLQDTQRADTLQKAVPGSVTSLEGANEYNISSYNLDGQNSYGNSGWGALDDQDLQGAVAADPTLAGVKVVAAATGSNGAAPQVGQYVDVSNWHVYAGDGGQLAGTMAAGVASAQATAPGKPVYITEAGISSSGYGSGQFSVTDEVTQGVIDTNALLDAYQDGASKTFLYELMDDTNSTAEENAFGLFHTDGTAKPVATDISNLLHILSDGGAGPANPGKLSYGVSGLPSTASSMLLEKANGTWDIVVWNGNAAVSDGTKDVTPPTSNVTVSFASSNQNVSVFDPMQGTAALSSASASSSVSFGLSADPIVVEVTPAAAQTSAIPPSTPAPAPVTTAPTVTTIGSGADTLALQMAEDAWNGDAQYTVSVDGAQVGGTQTVTASQAAGASQTFDVLGNFSSGQHTVAIDFLNDAYGGTPQTDRNLYVDSASLDGTAIPNSSLTLDSSGTQSFSFGTPSTNQPVASTSTGSDSIVLGVAEDSWVGDAQYNISIDGVQVGGTQTATASQANGQVQDVTINGNWGTGAHTIGVSFINDAYGGSSSTDRNLYVDSLSYDGLPVSSASAALDTNGTKNFAVPAAGPVTLLLAEDAYQGDAQYSVSVDGNPVSATGTVTASNASGQAQAVELPSSLSAGTHDVAVSFLNDLYNGTSSTDRNLYVKGVEVNGSTVPGSSAALYTNGTSHFSIVVPSN